MGGSADAPRSGSGPVVFLIHGIDDSGGIFRRMRRGLASAGYRPETVDYTPSDGRLGIDRLAEQIRRPVETRLKSDPGPFGIVGFSMGGLVARALLASEEPLPARPSVFISISSPHNGTWMAWTRLNDAGAQMRPGSPFLARLNERRSSLNGIRLGTIRTPFDLVILPSSSSVLEGARNESVPVLLHPLMASDGRVIRLVIEMLDGTFRAPADQTPLPRADSLLRPPPGPGDG